MKKIAVKIFTLTALLWAFSGNAQTGKDAVLLKIDGKPTTVAEFENVYRKNNKAETIDRKDLEDYLNLYVNFRLKVREAEALGMDTIRKFKDELAGYRRQLAQPYLTDNETTENLLKEAYDRMKMDVNASHILIGFDEKALPKDTMEAWNKAIKTRQRILKGEDFAKVASEVSTDPSAKQNGGNLGYFTSMQMVYTFENACYTLPIGDISMPVRSKFGYHIIKVNDRRPAVGEISTAHIMIRSEAKDNSTPTDKASEIKIKEIYDSLVAGADFEKMAKKYSEDKGSANSGGKLPWFGTGGIVKEYEDAVFALKNDGDITKPFQTKFGWHIAKRLEKRGLEPFEKMKGNLKSKISRDSRSQMSRSNLVAKLKKEYKFTESKNLNKDFIKVLDTNYFKGNWDVKKASKLTKVMFKLADKSFTQQDYAKYLADNQVAQEKTALDIVVEKTYKDFVEQSIIDYENSQLEIKYPEFKALMQEYKDGILLFDLTDKKVWSKAIEDTTGLKEHYEKVKNNFMWPERAEATIYTCKDKKVLEETQKLLKLKGKKAMSREDIVKQINKDSELNLKIEDVLVAKGENDIVDLAGYTVGTKTVEKNNQVYLVEIKKINPTEAKKLNECKGLVTADYQNNLEVKWINELKSKYSFEVFKNNLQYIK